MIRLLVADDQAIVRLGVRQLVSETADVVVAGEAVDGFQAVAQALTGNYDVVILDISMPGKSGIDVLKEIRSEAPKLPVLILSIFPEKQYARRSLGAGASGYLTKNSAPEELIRAIRKVSCGKKYISSDLAEELAECMHEDPERDRHELLSDREYQIFQAIAEGKTPTEIASELCLSVKTVSTYRARILTKMKMKNNAELMRYAVAAGLTT